MKFILVIVEVLAVLAVVQALPQEAESGNQEEALEVPSESGKKSNQVENKNQIPELPQEKPHNRPHFRRPSQQQQHPHPSQEPIPEAQPEQNPNQDNSIIEEAEPVFSIGAFIRF